VALKNGVSINLFDQAGMHIGSFLPNVPLKAPKVTHEQLTAYYHEKHRLRLAKEFLLASIHNTNLVIRYYRKQSPEREYDAALETLERIKNAAKTIGNIQELMLLEARAREAYYGCYDLFLKHSDFRFVKRTRRPPQNEINALLSFGNTVLYNYIATEIEKTPLDVRVGFLHATTNRQRSLNLDLADIFKPLIVDRTVFSLINKKEIQAAHFIRSEKGSVSLSPTGKRILLQALYKKLETELTDKSGSRSYRQIITEEARQLVRHFRHGDKYKAFRQVR
jgi:CRISPR-associated endonuclease Cas1 subtype I-B